MNQSKEPTPEQEHIIRAHMLIPDNWLIQKETEQELTIAYKHGKTVKRLNKGENLWKGEKDGI